MSRGRKKRKASRKSYSNSKLGVVLFLIALLPVLYGLYLYCQQVKDIPQGISCPYVGSSQKVGLGRAVNAKSTRPFRHEEMRASASIDYRELEIPRTVQGSPGQVLYHKGYVVSYNRQCRIPKWVSYELTKQEVKGKVKRGNNFASDPLVGGATATNADYRASGYDKGHMAPAGDMKWSAEAMRESFYFSNICPQHPELNRRGWKQLEEQVREWALRDSAIIVICGPIMGKHAKHIGRNRVAVPERFFKVVLFPYSTPMHAIGFVFNNQRSVEPIINYAVTVDSVEQLAGLDFFAGLPDSLEQRIESDSNFCKWLN